MNSIVEQGEKIYDERLRDKLETPENIGRIVGIEVESGDYELAEGIHYLPAILRLRERHGDDAAKIAVLRIGYKTAFTRDGRIQRYNRKRNCYRLPGGNGMNAQSQHTPQEVILKGRAVYDEGIRSLVDTAANVGKFVSIEVYSGDYEMGDNQVETILRLRSRHADPVVSTFRIGYRATFTRGGRMTRETS